ncbi:uncharacterized protein ABDE67_010817 isoform 2-T2 [Symphorus nematophorus]
MVAMLVLVWFLVLMMTRTMKSAETITAHSGDFVVLSPDIPQAEPQDKRDIRWTHHHLMMSSRGQDRQKTCHHGRCELLEDGSLRFSRVQTADSGNYSVEVFNQKGKILKKKDFLLVVTEISSSSSVLVSVLMSFFVLLFLIFIVLFVLMRRRRSQKMSETTTGPLQENIYVEMHGNRSNKRKDEEKQEREEECHYVPCDPVVSMETPITQRTSVDAEDIYV